MLKINKKKNVEKWVKYDEDESIELLIKPMSLYYFKFVPTGDFNLASNEYKTMACKLIVDWKGIVDDNGKPLKCNDENKAIVADVASEIVGFVINKAQELKAEIGVTQEEAKN